MNTLLQSKLKHIPTKPGVYLFKDSAGDVIYVGKAKNLRNRVRSYFQESRKLALDKEHMVSLVHDLDMTVVNTETEAFLLEAGLIKKYKPKYNIVLRDDKNFSYIKITVKETYPRVLVVRNVTYDGSRYFGPYLSSAAVYETLHVLRKIFPYRTCDQIPKKPCLEYHMGRCIAPCFFESCQKEYQQVITDVVHFLQGDAKEVLHHLEQKMHESSKNKEYEKAARFRDQIRAVKRVTEKQHVISVHKENQDVVSVEKVDGIAGINVFLVRNGKLLGKANFILQHTEHATEQEILEAFLKQYYTQVIDVPKEIIVPFPVTIPGFPMKITVPQRGHKRQLLAIGKKNAKEYVEQSRVSWEKAEHKVKRALRELREALQLPRELKRIEVYDISNIQGYEAVGSMIVFEDGKPCKGQYKKFKIHFLQTPNDYAMLQEVLYRRLKHTDWKKPDLLLIDGGKGQLSSVKKILDGINVTDIPVASLAKQEEELFVPDHKTSMKLPKDSEGLFLVQRMRDEAHRFAIGYYRQRHGKALIKSVLDDVPQLGPKRKKMLLAKFGSVSGIRQASDEDIVKIVGEKLLKNIREFL